MASKASIAGHPIHPMLVPIPIGLFVFALVADCASRVEGASAAWPEVALYCIGGGIVGALLAAPFGLIDLLSLDDERAKKVGITHMVINLTVVALFIINFILRIQGAADTTPFILTLIGIGLLLVSGWLGGHLVYVLGVAQAGPGERVAVERRRVRTPVSNERRHRDTPIGQH
ncbi:MAG TPA: DUF2231 domain-containing protein [Burkholderiales bacterium]|jgi:uncharacterized membrane protein|nr:DUF2231 domain-containing protein [Burkholderiales bacterium]